MMNIHDSEKGSALVLVLAVLMTLMLLGLGVITSTSTNISLSRNFETSTQAQNMADIGVRVAYREFINGGFLNTTHKEDLSDIQVADSLLTTELSDYVIDEDGDFVWEWDENSPYDPMFDTDQPHGIKFHIYYTTSFTFVIECEGWYGNIHRRTRAKGEIETMFQFSYFASRDLGEFVRGASQEIRGKVHANGTMYVRPSGSTLKVNTDSFTSSGNIIRTRDAWGRPDASGSCEITKDSQDSGTWVEMDPGSPRGSESLAFDSLHANWLDKDIGARSIWGGVVRDKVPYKSPPPIDNLDLGEYYQQHADDSGLVIDSNSHSKTWCSRVNNFYNYNEARSITIWEIDIAALGASGDWPSNSLIYCEVPVRLANASELNTSLMVASCRTVYTKGHFNTVNKKGASIMTLHRIVHLSDDWNDATYNSSTLVAARPAITTQINAALVDGAPTVDEYNWCDRDGDNYYDVNGGIIYNPESPKTAAGFNTAPSPDIGSQGSDRDPWANVDDLLEDWSGITLTKLGSTVHLGTSYDVMCPDLTNAGITDDELAWIRRTGYKAPTRVYLYDPDLATPGGQPPFTPMIGHLRSWEPF